MWKLERCYSVEAAERRDAAGKPKIKQRSVLLDGKDTGRPSDGVQGVNELAIGTDRDIEIGRSLGIRADHGCLQRAQCPSVRDGKPRNGGRAGIGTEWQLNDWRDAHCNEGDHFS